MGKEEATLILRIKQFGAESLQAVRKGINEVGKVAAAAAVALAAGVAKSIGAWKEQELAINRLNQSMVNNGDFSRKASQDLQNFASQLQATSTFGDETIISMLSLAKSFGVSNEEAKKMIKAAANLSAATGMELESAVKNLGKTFAGMTGELGESVPALRELTAEQLKSGAAIDMVAAKFEGSTEATIQGLGALDQLKNTAGDFLETIGKSFAPFISLAARALNSLTNDIQTNEQSISRLNDIALNVAKSFSWLKNRIIGVGELIGTSLAATVESVSLLMQGQFSKAKEVASLGMEEIALVYTERQQALNEELEMIEAVREEQDAARKKREEQLIIQSNRNKLAIEKKKNKDELTEEQKRVAALLGVEAKSQKDSEKIEQAKLAAKQSTLATISSLQGSNNKRLAAIGKAAALTQIAIATPQAIAKALAAFPPPINFAAAGAVGAAMAAQTARVVGIPLEEGGLVKGRAGGVQATIGEAGRDELVVPLDDVGGGGFGGVTINFSGPVLGDEGQAREFAIAIDRELLELRKNNESQAFETSLA